MMFFLFFLFMLMVAASYAARSNNTIVARKDTWPDFQVYDSNPQTKDARAVQMEEGFADAWELASVAALTFNPCDATFLRYFDTDDADFTYIERNDTDVLPGVFDEIANLQELSDAAEPWFLSEILKHKERVLNPKFALVSISAGDHHELELDERECELHDPSERTLFAHARQFGDLGDRALISLCDAALRFPTLNSIVINDERRTGRGDPGCDGMGAVDSGWMTSLGGHILPEIIHWRYIFVLGIDDWIEVVTDYKEDEDDEKIIVDYDANEGSFMTPPSGYGPYNTRALASHRNGEAINNADNYRWYAPSKYFQWKCGRSFGPAPDETFGDDLRLNQHGNP